VSDSRKRQSKRDDAIRRKIEHDLNKKRKNSTQINRFRKGSPGSVLSLRPSDPILCKKNATGLEVSQLMTAKRENCILVTDDKGGLLGIFTAKDLAFRIVGSKLNANVITIDQIMTSNPICVDTNTSASDALN
ncbi:CBS domain-containing protein, partial [Xanthomonas citri pv. citri]